MARRWNPVLMIEEPVEPVVKFFDLNGPFGGYATIDGVRYTVHRERRPRSADGHVGPYNLYSITINNKEVTATSLTTLKKRILGAIL
jgi:hypothetical protein